MIIAEAELHNIRTSIEAYKMILKNNDDLKNARHDDNLSVEELVSNSSRLLKDGGKLFVVYKSSDLVDLINCLSNYKFGIRELKFILDDNKEYSNCFLLEAIKGYKSDVRVTKPVYITH